MNANSTNDENQTVGKKILRFIWSLIPFFILVMVIVIMGVMCGAKNKAIKQERAQALKAEDPGINVVTLELIPKPLRDRINLPGMIEPWVMLDVLSEVQGKITAKPTKEGDKINQGDVLVTVDQNKYDNAYRSSKAAYEASLSSKKRLEQLFAKQLSNKSDLDNMTAQVENLKAVMDNAVLDLENCTIKAPISGIINRIHVETGQYVNIASKIAEIIQIDKVKVKVGIPESDINSIRNVNHFTIRIDALNEREIDAKKHFLSKIAGKDAILYDLELAVNNPNLDLLPGMFARVEIIKREIPESISIPIYAIISNNDSHIVYIENDGLAHRREVELGLQDGWLMQVTKGLEKGEKVVVTGQRNLNEGQLLNVVRRIKDLEEMN
ncbi:MAG: efflux RND transporter periplasmic adaptor subunit [Proteobacteria bacterium]|nr:efflux RND transporter periplasmic adaptor subunit [Pseudomonadota bacterium]